MFRLQQVLVITAGLAVAGVMVALGLWQLGVYRSSGNASAEQRVAAPVVALGDVAPEDQAITDGYGRTVQFTGSYDPELQLLVGDPGTTRRIVTGFRLTDGRLLAVVRGVTAGAAPPPPTGTLRQAGVLLPSEDSGDPATSIRVPLLAQTWPGQLIEGYVNLTTAESAAQGVQPSPLDLPEAPGRLRNGAYALQWWLFAGFALVLAVRIARDLDRGRDLELAAEADADEATAGRQESEESSATT